MPGYKRETQQSSKWDVFIGLVITLVFIGSCAPAPSVPETISVPPTPSITNPTQTQSPTLTPTPMPTQEVISMPESIVANVLAVEVTGQPNAYQFNVQVSSPDTGCDQYADWWEVLSEDGQLLYRRVLLHSHVSEQPFTRSGGPVAIDENTILIVRAHMNVGGYGGLVLRGSVTGSFKSVEVDRDFAATVETQEPLPDGCAF